VIVCPRCAKENQDHYKFCLGCGAELPRDAAHAPKSFTAPTPPASFQGAGAQPGAAHAQRPGFGAPAAGAPAGYVPPPAAPPPAVSPSGRPPAMGAPMAAPGSSEQVICPKCGTPNSKNFKFCGGCGFALQGVAPQPVAPAAPPPPAAAAVPPAPLAGIKRGQLVLIRPDGSEGDSFPLGDTTLIGRESGGLFASDSYLSPRHATFTFGAGGLTVSDDKSLNGVYLRIAADTPTELRDGAIFRIGQEIVRFERLKNAPSKGGTEIFGSPSTGLAGRICLVIGREATGNCYAIPSAGIHLGRERGDLLFPDDGYVSGLHCRIYEEGGRVLLTDVGSSNGTFVRLTAPTAIPPGSLLLMGQQLFRVEY
jgi:pSer/pThr/pTyr-binding forkhead associated (FHA) protein